MYIMAIAILKGVNHDIVAIANSSSSTLSFTITIA